MPIADCGFPPLTVVPGSNPRQVVLGSRMLVDKGPTTSVQIGFTPDLFHADPNIVQAAKQSVLNQSPPTLVEALIDSGASDSCIDESLAVELGLPLVNRVQAAGVGGGHEFNVYLGYIRIVALNYVQYGRFMGVLLQDGGQPHHVLLGRSLLKDMILVYDGRDGTCRLAI